MENCGASLFLVVGCTWRDGHDSPKKSLFWQFRGPAQPEHGKENHSKCNHRTKKKSTKVPCRSQTADRSNVEVERLSYTQFVDVGNIFFSLVEKEVKFMATFSCSLRCVIYCWVAARHSQWNRHCLRSRSQSYSIYLVVRLMLSPSPPQRVCLPAWLVESTTIHLNLLVTEKDSVCLTQLEIRRGDDDGFDEKMRYFHHDHHLIQTRRHGWCKGEMRLTRKIAFSRLVEPEPGRETSERKKILIGRFGK